MQTLGVAVLRLPRRADPIVHGMFTNWNDMEKIQRHSFYDELRVTLEGHFVLPTEALLNPEANWERMTQTRFETFNMPAMYVATQAACVFSFTSTAERTIARDVKENLTYVGLNYDTEHRSIAEIDKEETYELPVGNISTVGAERFRCVEVLFQPFSRIHGTSFQNNMKCDVYICKTMSCFQVARPCDDERTIGPFSRWPFITATIIAPRHLSPEQHEVRPLHPPRAVRHVVLSIGTTMFQVIFGSMTKEPTAFSPSTMKIKVFASRVWKYPAWVGGSILPSCEFSAVLDLEGRVRWIWPFHRPIFLLHGERFIAFRTQFAS